MNKLLDLFIELVKIDSPTGHEDQIGRFVIEFFEKRNIKAKKDKFGNIIVNIKGVGEPLFLSAHMDTVEPGKGIKPIVKNGIIRSSGETILGADNKAALAAILHAVDKLIQDNSNHRSLDLVFTRHEESENLGALNLDYKFIRARNGFIFDAAKPLGTVIISSPYYLRFDLEILGKSAHASRPENANNCVLVFADAMKKIKLGRIDSKTIVNIGVISAGYVRNTIPGEMKLAGEVRSFKKGVVEKVSKDIITIFKKSAEKYGSRVKSNVVLENPGYDFSKSEHIVNNAIRAIKNIKLSVKTERYYGCSDANVFVEKGLRILNLGNGSKNAHTIDEQISVKEFENLNKLILSLISS